MGTLIRFGLGLGLVFIVLAACVGRDPTVTPQVVGGYIDRDPNLEPIPAVYQFAVEELKKSNQDVTVTAIRKAESQVVAGTNFRLTLGYVRGSQVGTLVAVVYIPLGNQPQYQLTSVAFDGRGSP